MNRTGKTSVKMDEEMAVMDATMPTAASNPDEQKPLQTSACLAEKLQKLKDTPKPNADAMECESEDLKK